MEQLARRDIPGTDAFVAKLTHAGEHAWSTYMGGLDQEDCRGIAIADSGIYLTGWTESEDWISGSFDTTYDGLTDAFVARIAVMLTVKSLPFPGVSISGTAGGITDYVRSVTVGSSVILTAPTVVSISDGVRHNFSHWLLDGAPQPEQPGDHRDNDGY